MSWRDRERPAHIDIYSAMQPDGAPALSKHWALFLDIDGTLLDVAETPSGVVVPQSLPVLLMSLSGWLDGALALVSGRRLENIDRLLAPAYLPCAAEHGAFLRLADGSIHAADTRYAVPMPVREHLRSAVRVWPGVIVEEKQFTIAVHYRQAPSWQDQVAALVRTLADEAGDGFEAMPARKAFELRHRSLNKGEAVRKFMSEPAFLKKTPVFVGDDVTDEDGFSAAIALNGLALDVRERFDRSPAQVKRWLASFEDASSGQCPDSGRT